MKQHLAPERLTPWMARVVAIVVGVLLFYLLPSSLDEVLRALAAWDLAVLVLVAEGWAIILSTDAEEMRQRATAEDPGKAAIFAISFGASAISLGLAVLVIGAPNLIDPRDVWLRTALGLGAILGAWLLLHTAYTLHYARLYYASPATLGGINFTEPPDALDFAYFAFGIGMTFQVAEIAPTNRAMRRAVLRHELISFAYNTAILAMVVNIIASQV
ncbi:MAG: DUF1345 domain-containing protein [Thermomicrobiales bacterium]